MAYFRLQTGVGPVFCTITDYNHVYVTTHENSSNYYPITIRGRLINFSAHVHRVNGKWTCRNDPKASYRRDIYARYYEDSLKDATTKQVDVIEDIVTQVVSKYAKDNDSEFLKSEITYLRGRMNVIIGEIKELNDKVAAKEKELNELAVRRDVLLNAIQPQAEIAG